MNDRKQQKFGWIGGWLGGFIWVLILSIIFLVQGKGVQAWIGLAITFSAVIVIVYSSPWKHPRTMYRLLMMPIYVLFFAACCPFFYRSGRSVSGAGMTTAPDHHA